MSNTNDYSLWLFLDLENYGESRAAKVLEKSLRKTPEFRGVHKSRLYFEFANAMDKNNFILTVSLELNRQRYRWVYLKEEDPNTPRPKSNENIKSRVKIPIGRHTPRRSGRP